MKRACIFCWLANRRNSTLQLLKRAVDEKRFGRIHMVHVNVFGVDLQNTTTRPLGVVPGTRWRCIEPS